MSLILSSAKSVRGGLSTLEGFSRRTLEVLFKMDSYMVSMKLCKRNPFKTIKKNIAKFFI